MNEENRKNEEDNRSLVTTAHPGRTGTLPGIGSVSDGLGKLSAATSGEPNWHACDRELRVDEWKASREFARKAWRGWKHLRRKKCTVHEVIKLFELASTFGRRATGTGSNASGQGFAKYNDPDVIAQIDREMEEVLGKAVSVIGGGEITVSSETVVDEPMISNQ